MHVDQPPAFVQSYSNAPHHRPARCRAGLYPGTLSTHPAANGDIARAIEYYLMVWTIAKETGDNSAEVQACNSLGMAYRKIGNYPKAIEYHDFRLALVHKKGDKKGTAETYLSLGLCYYSMARYHKAVAMFEHCLEFSDDAVLHGKASDSLTRAQVCIYVCMYVCIYIYTCKFTHVFIHWYVCIFMYVYSYMF